MNIELIPADTTTEAFWVQVEILRRLGGNCRLEMVCEMNDTLRAILLAGVRSRHPEYTEREVKLGMIRLWLGDELFRKVYPGVNIAP